MYSSNLHMEPHGPTIGGELTPGRPSERAERVSVLVVDRDDSWRQLLCDMLLMSGLRVESCCELAQVDDILRRAPVELIVADIDLPGSEPWLEWMAREHRDISLIATTGSSDVQQAVHTMRHGAFDYLVKPFKVGTLVNSVENGLQARARRAHQIQSEGALSLHRVRTELHEQSELTSQLEILTNAARRELSADDMEFILDGEMREMVTTHAACLTVSLTPLKTEAINGHDVVIAHGRDVFNFLAASDVTDSISTVLIAPLVSQQEPQGWLIASRRPGSLLYQLSADVVSLVQDHLRPHYEMETLLRAVAKQDAKARRKRDWAQSPAHPGKHRLEPELPPAKRQP